MSPGANSGPESSAWVRRVAGAAVEPLHPVRRRRGSARVGEGRGSDLANADPSASAPIRPERDYPYVVANGSGATRVGRSGIGVVRRAQAQTQDRDKYRVLCSGRSVSSRTCAPVGGVKVSSLSGRCCIPMTSRQCARRSRSIQRPVAVPSPTSLLEPCAPIRSLRPAPDKVRTAGRYGIVRVAAR